MNSRKSPPTSSSTIRDAKAPLPEGAFQALKQVAQQNQAHNIGLEMLAISPGICGFELVTRNTKDFEVMGIDLFDLRG